MLKLPHDEEEQRPHTRHRIRRGSWGDRTGHNTAAEPSWRTRTPHRVGPTNRIPSATREHHRVTHTHTHISQETHRITHTHTHTRTPQNQEPGFSRRTADHEPRSRMEPAKPNSPHNLTAKRQTCRWACAHCPGAATGSPAGM